MSHADNQQERDGVFIDNNNRQNQQQGGTGRWKLLQNLCRIVTGVLLLVLILHIVFVASTNDEIEQDIEKFLNWVEDHPALGVLAVIGVYTLATILFVPGSLLTVGTGFAFGAAFPSTAQAVGLASLAVFLGASIGSIACFLLGRYLFRDCVVRMANSYPIFQAVDRALQGNGLKIMTLLRLSPLIPYNALDYLSGITAISLRDYSLAMFAMLPGIIVFVFTGASASSLAEATDGDKTTQTIVLVVGIVFAIVGVAVASYYSKKELDLILQEQATNGPSIAQQQGASNIVGSSSTVPLTPVFDEDVPATSDVV